MPVSLLADTCTQLGYQAESGPWRNFCLTGARELLKSDIPYTSQLINDGVIAQMDMDMLLDYCAIQIDGEKAAGKDAVINIRFTDTGDKGLPYPCERCPEPQDGQAGERCGSDIGGR